jgi:hypothetical protein
MGIYPTQKRKKERKKENEKKKEKKSLREGPRALHGHGNILRCCNHVGS